MPSGKGWYNTLTMSVNGSSAFITQLAMSIEGECFYRSKNNGNWSSWSKL